MSEYEKVGNMYELGLEMVADWIGCGIDPKKSIIFRQSDVFGHLELAFIFGVLTPLPWLERCPTYKEQLKELKGRELTTYGFLGYPVLQAADILLYKAQAVPVGDDQLPHLELTREIARRFNALYKKEVFPHPEAILTKTPRLLGIDNRKMSKSYNNFIALADEADIIRKKVLMMVTDPKRIRKHDLGHPEICNVYAYYKSFKPEACAELEEKCQKALIGCRECKENLAQILINHLKNIRNKRKEILHNKKELIKIMDQGKEKAMSLNQATIKEVKKVIGL
jgi:tryptophanyl-tRNA synthetase